MLFPDDFAVFILSHGRPDRVYTYNTLQKVGYTGKLYIIIDNEDNTAQQYYKLFGDKVIMFDKIAISKQIDEGDNFQDRRAVIYARNACFNIAVSLGIKWFMELDDDYFNLCYKIDDEYKYLDSSYQTIIKDGNNIIYFLLEFYKRMTNCFSLAIAQGGDYIGGAAASIDSSLGQRRKAMNTFLCSVERPFYFVGRVNEDVNTYTSLQNKGYLFLTFPLIAIQQKETQKYSGGMSEMYLDSGTYIKSFYTVMYQPSSVRVGLMGETHKRLHHHINWDNTVPCIIPEKFRKSNIP